MTHTARYFAKSRFGLGVCFNNRLTDLDASKMKNPSNYYLICGRQTTDGITAQTLSLTLREEQKENWDKLKQNKDNTDIVLTN